MSLFRPEAVDAKRRRLWGEVRISQPPTTLVWTVVLSSLCLVLFATLIFGSYTRKETVAGFITPEAGIVQIKPAQAGRVARVLVRDGEAVDAGASLIEFTSDVASIGNAPVLDIQLTETGRQSAAIEEQRSAVRRATADEERRLRQQINGHQQTRTILAGQRLTQAEAVALAEANAQRFIGLQGQGYAPNSEVETRRRALLTERSALASLDARLAELSAAEQNLRDQLAALPARQAGQLAELASDAANVAQRHADLSVARGYSLRAPVAGTVSSIQARPGMTPALDQPLLWISPKNSALEARLLVPTRAVGFLRVGQVARLQVEAFPFQRFGFVNGRIVDVASTVTRPGEAIFPVSHEEPVYEVRVELDETFVDAYGERRPLLAGMNLRADLPIDRRRLWQQLFDPLLAAGRRAS